jgi:hypothetical protein
MDLEPINENACNHEEVRAALSAANVNFRRLKEAIDRVTYDLEEIKRTQVRPT